MKENGTFIALITINLGGIGLIGTYLLATYFFYVDRANDLKIILDIEFEKLRNRIYSRYIISRRENSHSIFMHDLLLLNADAIKTTQIKGISKSEIYNKYLKIIDHYLIAGSDLLYLEVYPISNIYKLDTKDKLDELLTSLGKLQTSYEETKYNHEKLIDDFEIMQQNLFQIESISNLDTKYKKTFDTKHNLSKSILDKVKKDIIDQSDEVDYHLTKLYKLNKNKSDKLSLKYEYYCILSSALFGIILPLVSISTLPYETHFIPLKNIQLDISYWVAAFLAFASLLPYGIILSKLRYIINKKSTHI